MKFEFSRQIFEQVLNIKFHQNPSIGSRDVPCGQTDMTKLIVAFRNFANATKNCMNRSPTMYHTQFQNPNYKVPTAKIRA
jgi:hypothetical protein